MDDFQGKVAVVTGAANGIGRALAAEFSAAGMRVVLADLDAGPLEETAAEMTASGADVIARVTDVADTDAVDHLAAATLEAFERVDVVCNNAGVNRFAPFWDLSPADWRWILDVNLGGVINGIRSFLPVLRAQGSGHIVNTASMAVLMLPTGTAPYTASKFGVLALSDVLRADLAKEGSDIGVTVLCPGKVATDIANAERHRRDGVPSTEDEATARFRDVLAAEGMPPSEVAPLVLAAIRERRAHVFTHPGMVRPALAKRAALMLADLPNERPE